MGYYILGALLLIGAFVAGFFVGNKHGKRVTTLAEGIKDVVGKS